MTSAGGLVPAGAAAERPAALVLSGPAGGVLAGAHAAAANGFPDAVTFDMGGTSTDVCLVLDGRPAPASEREVAGLPVRLPSLDVHTIGAGGGSIARLDDGGALLVGPRSAGAVPGPACYGRGGVEPTVTDADLVAGRIPAGAAFPGLGALDARRRPTRRSTRRASPPTGCSPWSTRPWRRPSGSSPSSGASTRGTWRWSPSAGRGRCTPAPWPRRLGMAAVIVPARAGVLSAVGHPRRTPAGRPGAVRPRPARPRGRGGDAWRRRCGSEAVSDRRWSPRSARPSRRVPRVVVRLPLRRPEPRAAGGRPGGVPRRAPAAQRLRPARPPRRGGGGAGPGWLPSPVRARRPAGARPVRRGRPGRDRRAGLHDLGARRLGGRAGRRRCAGAAAVAGAGGRAGEPRARLAAGPDRPAHRDRHRDGRGAAAQRVQPQHQGAGRPLRRPVHPEGELLVQAEHIPVHLGSMPASVAAAIERFGPGTPSWEALVDASGPVRGPGEHGRSCSTTPSPGAPTSTTSPSSPRAWSTGRLVGWVANRAHHADVGGAAPGSMPADATEVFAEGLRIPPVRLTDEVRALLLANSRTPDERAGDLDAQVGANRRGVERLAELRRRPARRGAGPRRAADAGGPGGPARRRRGASPTWSTRSVPAPDQQVETHVAGEVTVAGDEITFDLSASDPQRPGNVNAVRAVTVSAATFALRSRARPDHPGQRRRAAAGHGGDTGRARSSTPWRPAAVGAGNVEVSQRVADVCLRRPGRGPHRPPRARRRRGR